MGTVVCKRLYGNGCEAPAAPPRSAYLYSLASYDGLCRVAGPARYCSPRHKSPYTI